MINKSIVELEQKIIDLINEANMPPAIVGLILSKITRNVDDLTIQVINKEMTETQSDKEDIEIKNENE